MKTPMILLLSAATLLLGTPALAQAGAQAVTATTRAATPKFDELVLRLNSCHGLTGPLMQWCKVLKAALKELG